MKTRNTIRLFLLNAVLMLSCFIQSVYGQIITLEDGNVIPSNAPIKYDAGKYIFRDNIYCDSISLLDNNVTIDGNDFILQGTDSASGLNLTDRSNVVIKHMLIENFNSGILLSGSNNIIYRNTIRNCDTAVDMTTSGIDPNNKFYQNNFINNDIQVRFPTLTSCSNTWNDGYLSGGNFWSDHDSFTDNNSGTNQDIPSNTDGICDNAYDKLNKAGNIDDFPLTEPYNKSVLNIDKGLKYYTIQEALEDADEAQTIRILSGNYYENLVIDKSIQLVGEGIKNTIVDGIRNKSISSDQDVITLSADNTRIESVTIKNAGNSRCGIETGGCNYIQIIGNIITDHPNGINLNDSDYISIIDNSIFDTNTGICINDSNSPLVSKNRIGSSAIAGTSIQDSNASLIVNNTFTSNQTALHLAGYSYDNQIRGNKVVIAGDLNADGSVDNLDLGLLCVDWLTYRSKSDLYPTGQVEFKDLALFTQNYEQQTEDANGFIIEATKDANTTIIANIIASRSNQGIGLYGTSGNRISDNVLIHNRFGIELSSAPNNVIINNTARLNTNSGIYLNDSNNVSVTGNQVFYNSRGIHLENASDNVSIIENEVQDGTNGINLWDCCDCNLMSNIITNSSSYGISMEHYACSNTLWKNRIKYNYFGVCIDPDCGDNEIYHNIFIANTYDAIDGGESNFWYYKDYQCDPNSLSGGNLWDKFLLEANPEDVKHGYNIGGTQSESGPDFGNCSKYGIADINYEFDEFDDHPNDLYPLILVDSNITTLSVQQQQTWKWAGSVFPVSQPRQVGPYKPRMDRPYILNISLHNTAGDLADGDSGEVYYGGVKQVDAEPGAWMEWTPDEPEYNLYGWLSIGGWDLEENMQEEPCSPPCPIQPDEVNEFQPIFKNTWNWIETGDWKGAIGSIVLSIPKISGPVCSFILASYRGNRAVPTMTYTFEHMEDTAGASDIIIFSKDVTVEVPLSKQADLRDSVRMDILSIALSLAAKACSGTIAAPAAPALYAASICCMITSMELYDSAADPLEDCTQIVKPIDVPVPQDINALEEGAVKQLALAAIDMVSLEHAYAESYIRYDSARTFDGNEPNESYMGMQLGAAIRYNAMAAQKLRHMQRLLVLIDADPDIPKPTYSTIVKLREDVDANGLQPVQSEILEVFDRNNPVDPNDPNESDIRNMIWALTDPLDSNLVALWLDPENLTKTLYTLIRGRYLAEHAMEIAAEAEELEQWMETHFAHNVGINKVFADITEVCRAGMLEVSVELENYGNETELVDVNVYAGTNEEPNLFLIHSRQMSLPAGRGTAFSFDWDMDEITTPGTHTYRLKAQAVVSDVNDIFEADNTLTGQTVIVIVPADITAPEAPSLNEISVYDDTTATLTWTQPSGSPVGYRIYRDGSLVWSGWTADTTYTDTGLSPSTEYTYKVSAYDADGNESDTSNTQTVTTSGP